ncbi:MAG: DeoR/GlpR transcriptional regulator [Mesorhizobium sp.]|uniref:DeoR/GlpR family DNA-binding transcription regulator n=1 Tax=Mesorhizobium sp. TaxID=1871066 RepID=UPI000FE9C150|nr:DeoR/GlpR family DNA-binding transcription regulator [Mesorhizobium sp.]RWI48954.1 MAG: DeoR/GlpR transcriptional regulator [Mesorhizobium sp.]
MGIQKSRKGIRRDNILAALERNPALRVVQIAEELGVSTETVRRDLTVLESTGRLSRTYGGAVKNTSRFEPALNERLSLKVSERRAIAMAAVSRYATEDALLLGGGATMLQFARALREVQRRITVVTPAYPIAVELAQNPMIEIIMLPGIFEPQEHMTVGPDTSREMDRYKVRTAIIGASGLSAEGVSEALLRAGEVYGAMIEKSEQAVVLADSDKFDKRALVLLTDWNATTTLITDVAPQGALRTALELGGTKVIVASGN